MPTIDSAVTQATEMLDKGTLRPATPAGHGMMSAPPNKDVKDTMSSFPMPSLQAFSDPVRQGNRDNVVPQYRSIPPTPTPATNITINEKGFVRSAGGGVLVISGGGSSVVTNTPGTPGSPGTPTGPIPVSPTDTGDLTAATPVAVSSVRQVIGGPAIISVETMGPSGPSHQRGVVPDPGAVAGTTRFLREDATWVAIVIPPDVDYEPVTNGDPAFPEVVFSGGDIVMG